MMVQAVVFQVVEHQPGLSRRRWLQVHLTRVLIGWRYPTTPADRLIADEYHGTTLRLLAQLQSGPRIVIAADA